MNPYQFAYQIRYRLLAEVWPDSPGEVVFGAASGLHTGSVRVSDGPTEQAIRELRIPWVLIGVGDVIDADLEEPGLFLQQFPLILGARVEGDAMGERILMGGPRVSVGSSQSRGILEYEVRLKSATGKLTGADGARAALVYVGSPGAERIQGQTYSMRKYNLNAWCTSEPHYDPPVHLVAAPAGGGAVNLSWALPPNRWDRRQIVLRRAAGATAPSSATAGFGVTLSGDLATSVSDSPGVGTFSYALFCGYTETGAASNERYSAQELGSYRNAVVVT